MSQRPSLLVWINGRKRGEPRRKVEARLVKRNRHTVIVELPDGHIVKRKNRRDLAV